MPSNDRQSGTLTRVIIAAVALAVALAAVVFVWRARGPALPAPGSAAYEETATLFYRGLAGLQVGLLENAVQDFEKAASMVPPEPATWANLGVSRLRLGDVDAAAEPIGRALMLAPDNGDMALLAAQMEVARGRLDEAVVLLRRAVELDEQHLRARFALAEELERTGTPEGDAEAAALLDELQRLAPGNVAVLLERARVAAKRSDAAALDDSVARLSEASADWPDIALEQYRGLQDAARSGNFAMAARSTALLRNVLARVPGYGTDVAAVRTSAERIAEPFDRFLVLEQPPSTPAAADTTVTFTPEPLDERSAATLVPVSLDGTGAPVLFAADAASIRRLGDTGGTWPFPGDGTEPGPWALAAIDWNNDFRNDVFAAGRSGVRLLLQNDSGGFDDATEAAGRLSPVRCGCLGAWPADIEMDGDLDLVVGVADAPALLLRNNGDGTWMTSEVFAPAAGVQQMVWADLDRDLDADAALVDGSGRVRVFLNRQAGQFVETPAPESWTNVDGMTVADIDADGTFELIVARGGAVTAAAIVTGGGWDEREIVQGGVPGGRVRLIVADLDNNGALDLLAAGGSTRTWLANERHELEPFPAALDASATAAADVNGDGRVDVIGLSTTGSPVRLVGGGGAAGYHWKQIRARGQPVAGDQRINSFGVGGEIEVRSGLLRQKQVLTGLPLHFGLGARTAIDVARIVWPNGNPQAEFGTGVDDAIVAEQRLKGSCPWVFAYDGEEMRFVTDFLWRSPLGLRINAQDTAGVSQTEDWVRIRGDQLAARDGVYDVRITAELWETHFFDHVSLLVVDHPDDTEVFVDERFSAAPVPFEVRALRGLRAVTGATDEHGRDVSDRVSARDGRYLASFERGRFQGIATDHFVEFDVPDLPAAASGRGEAPARVLVAQGWVYPTDSSINVAVAQGRHDRPRGVSLEARDERGTWRVVHPDLGFPAGKDKTMLIDLDAAAGARRLRLRTNMEVYWDALLVGVPADATLRRSRLAPARADLRYRGFSRTTSPRGEAPETPAYTPIAARGQRWRDLTGYHTRFGDVRELLAEVDDRYVIMNAGDELVFGFAEPAAAGEGWRRDFFLIGDGWEKDGDYNTEHSQTVLPLPSHGAVPYDSASPPLELEDDPVYRRHREDWERYHTRYVTPSEFVSGLALQE